MKRIILAVIILLLISEGTGCTLLKKLNIGRKGFAAPLGFMVLLGCMQLLYYPAQLFNLSFTWIIIPSAVVLAAGCACTLLNIRDVFRSLKSKNTLILLGCACFFLFVFSRMYVDMDYSDTATYLNYVAFNINAPKLNWYDLGNGLRNGEWNVYYLFQGYFHFASFFCWLVNIPYYLLSAESMIPVTVVCVWGLGLLYQVLSGALIINVAGALPFRNRYIRGAVLLFLLLYSNFFYWDVTFAFYGNTYRGLYIMLSVYMIYRWMKEDCENMKYLLIPVTAAGLACSSSSLFMGFSVLYSLAAWLFVSKRKNALHDMALIIMSMVFYVCAFVSRPHTVLAAAILIFYILVMVFWHRSPLSGIMNAVERFLTKYAKEVFFIAVPAVFVIGSFVIHLTEDTFFTKYAYYLHDFRHLDMITDYLFIHADWLEAVLDAVRWAGVILLLKSRREDAGGGWIRALVIMMLVFFLNPLCTIMLQKTITGMVFYRNFMVLFNPVTEAFFLYELLEFTAGRKPVPALICAGLAAAVLLGNIGSFMRDEKTGIYWVYIQGGERVDHIYKIDYDEHLANLALKQDIEDTGFDRQPVIVSQSSATLTYIPEGYQIFGSRDNHYPDLRVNKDFFLIAHRKDDWTVEDTPDYTKSCSYLKEYKADYVLVHYWDSPDFDQNSDACTVTFYEGSKYKVKKVISE